MSSGKKKKPVVIPNYCGFTEEEMFALYRIKSSPWFWRQKAEELKYAADLLWPIALKRLNNISSSIKRKKDVDFSNLPPETFSTAKGLLGFSLECLFKASIIRDNPNFMDNGQQDNQMHTHNLVKLTEIGKIVLTREEINVCQVLTDTMYVDFRYPIDREIKLENGSVSIGRNIIDVGNELYDKLHGTVDQIHTAKGEVIKFGRSTAKFAPLKKMEKQLKKK
ncbi:MAG: hypothetical protein JNL63_04535 [Bacteroidia bacterium]|nr:hypothetical protein [Bacteroidia bacterium]